MQSRRYESPGSRLSPHREFESGPDPYSSGSSGRRSSMRGEVADQYVRRSFSPRGMPQDAGVSQRSDAIDRREYGWNLGGGRNDRVRRRSRSRSPIPVYGDSRKRPHFDEEMGVLRRNCSPLMPLAPGALELRHRQELVVPGQYSVNDESNSRRVYGSVKNDSRISNEELNESRLSVGKHGTLSKNSTHMEDGAGRRSKSALIEDNTALGTYWPPSDQHPVVFPGESGGRLPSSPRSMNVHRFEQERLHYQEPVALDRLPVTESQRGKKPNFPSRDGLHPMISGAPLNPMISGSHSKDFLPSSSTGIRCEFQESYRGGGHLPSYDEFPSSSRNHTDSLSINAYKQRPVPDSSRDPDPAKRNSAFYQRCSPTRGEHDDYFYPKSRGMTVDDRGYPSDELHKMMPPRASHNYDHTQMAYDHTQMAYDRGNLSRPSIMNQVTDRIDNMEDSSGRNSRKGIMLNNPKLQRQSLSDYPDISRISDASKHGWEYTASGSTHVDFGRRMSHDHEMSHFGASQDFQISHLKADYGSERDVSIKYQERPSPVSNYDAEHRHTIGVQIMREELGICEPSDRVLKRNYVIEEDTSTHNPRTVMSGKWTSSELQDLYDSGEEWDDGDVGRFYTSPSAGFEHNSYSKAERVAGFEHSRYSKAERVAGFAVNRFSKAERVGGFDHNRYVKAERVYVGRHHCDEYASDDWLPSQHSSVHAQRNSVRYYKHGDRYIKGHRKSGPLSRHNSHHSDVKSGVHKQHRVWKRNDKYLEDVHAGDGYDADLLENGVSSAGPEPSEDSEEFIQMVQEAFLKYSKKLNMNPAVRRRYKEQGKAGTLFCIVCGQSMSKEFMDTQRLVTHAFMSHKVGLRAQHLGLLKAVCVLLGWSTVVPSDTVTWVPQVLPKAEAWAQKEDLILWPPVIIVHNISMSDDNPESWKVVTIEALEAFLRGKGLIRGRIKMCLGKPADQSVLVVKFLGTFTGLGDAERIQEYFAEHKRGRVDFERSTSYNGKIIMEGDSVEERLLYGYMGIVEDLDKVDFNTRNWSVIKSKKEIQDLADAPLKPDER